MGYTKRIESNHTPQQNNHFQYNIHNISSMKYNNNYLPCSIAAVLFCIIASGNAFSSHSRVFVGTPTKANPRLVRDCMTPNPRTLKTTDTVDAAIVALLAAGFNGAPVIDPITNNLVGCVTAFDFIQKEETGAILPFDTTDDLEAQQEMAVNARKIMATTVGELTTEPAV